VTLGRGFFPLPPVGFGAGAGAGVAFCCVFGTGFDFGTVAMLLSFEG
jgi:hypothetical protein